MTVTRNLHLQGQGGSQVCVELWREGKRALYGLKTEAPKLGFGEEVMSHVWIYCRTQQ